MVSIKDIAEEAGVSISTVSRVLNDSGYVKESTRKAVMRAIKKMNYRPSAIARSMVKRQSNIIGLLIPYFRAPFFAGLVDSIERKANEQGYNIMLCLTNEDTDKEREYLNLLCDRRVDGIILLPVSKEWDHIYPISATTPLVLVSRRSPDNKLSCVRANDIQGSFDVMDHLLESGHQHIYCVTGDSYMMNSIDRVEGIQQAYKKHGRDPDTIISQAAPMSFAGGYSATCALLDNHERPDAIYTVNQVMALGAVKAITERGLRIPQDLALASFAGFDELEYAEFIRPQITANLYPTNEIGIAAMNLLDEYIGLWSAGKKQPAPRDIVFNSEFHIRESTRRCC